MKNSSGRNWGNVRDQRREEVESMSCPVIFSDLICVAIVLYVSTRIYLDPMLEHRAAILFRNIGITLIATVILDHIWEYVYEITYDFGLSIQTLTAIASLEFLCVPVSFFFLLMYHRADWDLADRIMLAADFILFVLYIVNMRVPVFFSLDQYAAVVNAPHTALGYLGSLFLFGCILIHDFVTIEKLDLENVVLIVFNLVIASLGTADLYFSGDVISVWECYSISFLLLYVALVRLFAKTDPVIGLPNRNAFTVSYYRLKRRQVPVVVSFDLNHLKQFNDSKGHRSGDQYLRAFAQTALKRLSPYGKLYRVGGDEFFFTSCCDPGQVQKVLEDLSQLEVCDAEFGDYPMDFAYGLAVRCPGETNEDLYQRADEIMYQNKREKENAGKQIS